MINNRFPVYNYYTNADLLKNNAKANLRKTSSGLGFFVLSYFATMMISSFVLVIILVLFLGFDQSKLTSNSIPIYLLDIFISVFSAFIPGIIYFSLSGNSIAETINVKYVKQKILWPVVFVGLATAMFANYATDILLNNFSIFNLENSINFDRSSQSLLQNILYVIATAIVPAFAEEFAFRGVVMGTLRKYGDTFAIIATSVLFGAMHGNISQIPFAFILGLVFAYVDCITGSIIPSIIIHFINNFYAVMINILQSSNFIDNTTFYIVYYTIILLFCILGLLSFIYLSKKQTNIFKINNNTGVCLNNVKMFSLKEKNNAFFLNTGVILCLSVFIIETIFNTSGY